MCYVVLPSKNKRGKFGQCNILATSPGRQSNYMLFSVLHVTKTWAGLRNEANNTHIIDKHLKQQQVLQHKEKHPLQITCSKIGGRLIFEG